MNIESKDKRSIFAVGKEESNYLSTCSYTYVYEFLKTVRTFLGFIKCLLESVGSQKFHTKICGKEPVLSMRNKNEKIAEYFITAKKVIKYRVIKEP